MEERAMGNAKLLSFSQVVIGTSPAQVGIKPIAAGDHLRKVREFLYSKKEMALDEIHRQYHKVADLFPLMQGDEFEALKADIVTNGLREAICLHPDGSILDGRNRHRACIETGIEPRFRTWDGKGSLVGFVVSMNLHRRHLNESQRAMIAAKIANMPQGRQQTNTSIEVFSQPNAAKALNISNPSVQRARQVMDNGTPELRAAVEQGKVAVSAAAKAATELSEEEQNHFTALAVSGMTGTQARRELANTHTMQVMGSSESAEWYTPPHIIDLTLKLFNGTIDTDPCSNSKEHPNVPATFIYTKEDDGLAQAWHGSTYLNPPYGSEIPQWIEALVDRYERGEIREAIALLPGRIDTRWFQPLYDYLICHIRGRLNYPQSKSATPFPSIIVYLGNNRQGFLDIFSVLGPILERVG